jgi:excisionase family DNA binding protein
MRRPGWWVSQVAKFAIASAAWWSGSIGDEGSVRFQNFRITTEASHVTSSAAAMVIPSAHGSLRLLVAIAGHEHQHRAKACDASLLDALQVDDARAVTHKAADLLNVSRQYLVRLLDEGRIPFRKTGKPRRLRIEDVLGFKEKRDRDRRAGVRELSQMTQEFGGYDAESK